jgi:hypothetical protein
MLLPDTEMGKLPAVDSSNENRNLVHCAGCTIHDSLIVMGGVQKPDAPNPTAPTQPLSS